ncbi:MAG: hypothetical protein Q9220_005821 [cf. Caloplaca sp. 1 TL-2023]
MTGNGEWRSKRKTSPIKIMDRPSKMFKHDPLPETIENGHTPEYDLYNMEQDGEDPMALGPVAATADTAEWQATIEKVVRNVVSIHFCQTCAFDTDPAISSEATGFIVDAEKGYILTNRHVVGAGPFWGYCVFDNHEECDVFPVYRDPVHDFGILRFDPKAIKYMPLTELKLRPDLAKVGAEIRVVGNDGGEKLSILSGVISRLDRNAPEYGEGYSDFNTNYIQAAAAASGGSSGSPVVDRDGHVIALQAGGRSDSATTDYFLPLDRPLRALECIRKGEAVARGTIQTQWILKPFDECRRLGLSSKWETEVRREFPKETGMLVAEIVLPKGPADTHLEEGDVLVKVNDELLTQFVRLDAILDSRVDEEISIVVQRGGTDVEVQLRVRDLHAITPDRFVTVAGASFHNLSYQQARLHAIAVQGVFVCDAAGSFKFDGSHSGWLIESVDHKKTPDLDTFIEVMSEVPDRKRVVVTYKHLSNLHTLNTKIIHIDRHWSDKMNLAVRNDTTGVWDFTELAPPLPAEPPTRRKADFAQLDTGGNLPAADLIRSFVRVSCTMPLNLDGFPRPRNIGFGLVCDAEKGLVIVSRCIIPVDICDISLTIAESIIVEAKVVFLHPVANYAIIQYDPSLVDAPVKSARLAADTIKQGAKTTFLGFNSNHRPVVSPTHVTEITSVAIPANASAPRYRAINLDAIVVDTNLSGSCGTGVLIREDGIVEALWLNYLGERTSNTHKDVEYHLGLATPTLLPILNQIQASTIPSLRILNIETTSVQMSQCRIMGLSESWIEQVARANPSRHQLFMVRKVDCAPPSGHDSQSLEEGDIILTLNGQLITRVSEFDIMYDHEHLDALIVRRGEEMTLRVPTLPTADLETSRAVIFCGALLQAPHHAVRQQISKLHSEIYVSVRKSGSPAYQYGLGATNFITAVNDVPTQNLTEFVREANKVPDNTYFRLRIMTFDNVPWVATMKKCEHYFPTMEFVKTDGVWVKKTFEEEGDGVGGMGGMGVGINVAFGRVIRDGADV